MSIYKNVSQGGGVGMETNIIPWSGTGYNAVSGSNLTFTMAQLDPNNGRPFSNLFSSFKLPMISGLSAATWNQFAGTNFDGLNTPNICVISIASEQYGELIDGRTLRLTIPTGQTAPGDNIPATIDLYSSYVNAQNWSSDNSPAAARFGNPESNAAVDVGAASTNIAFMFTDALYPPQSPDHSTWANGYPSVWGVEMGTVTPTDAPSNYGVSVSNAGYYNILQTSSGATNVLPKTPALTNLSDTPVGIVYLDKGMIVLTDPTLMDCLLLSGMSSYVFSGDTGNYGNTASTPVHFGFKGARNDLTLGAFTASTSARCEFYSFEKERLISVVCVAGENEFYSTSNASAAPYNVGGAGGASTNISGVYDLEGGSNGGQDYSAFITELGLYDANNNLLAVAKPDRPIEKPKNSEQTFTLKFKF